MYEYYSVECKAFVSGRHCDTSIDLPGDPIFVEKLEFEQSEIDTQWPSDEWKADIACPVCGSIREYVASDVYWDHHEESILSEPYIHIRMECFHNSCRVPVEFYIVDFRTLANKPFEQNFRPDEWSDGIDWV